MGVFDYRQDDRKRNFKLPFAKKYPTDFRSEIEFFDELSKWKKGSKTYWASIKRKSEAAAIKEFKDLTGAVEWFAVWNNSPDYKDDTFEIYYKTSDDLNTKIQRNSSKEVHDINLATSSQRMNFRTRFETVFVAGFKTAQKLAAAGETIVSREELKRLASKYSQEPKIRANPENKIKTTFAKEVKRFEEKYEEEGDLQDGRFIRRLNYLEKKGIISPSQCKNWENKWDDRIMKIGYGMAVSR